MIYSILEQALIALPLILGGYLTLSLLKLPDFSIESAYLMGALAAYKACDLPLPFVLLSVLAGGMLVGMVVTTLNQILNLPFLLAAIITNGLFHGFAQFFLDSSVASFHLKQPVNELMLLLATACGLTSFLVFVLRSELGYSLAIFGNNQQMLSNHNISKRYVIFFGCLLGHACAALSGFLFAQANGFVDLTMNFGVLLLTLSSLMLGKLVFSKRKSSTLLPLAGVVGFFVIQQTLLHLGLNLKYFNAFQAIFILLILYFGRRSQNYTFDHLGV